MAKQWIELNGNFIDSYSYIGYQANTITSAFWGSRQWWLNRVEVHWFVVDMGESYVISKIRGRSNSPNVNPTDVDVFVSDDKENWGSAVATEISSWVATDVYVEEDLIEKTGRYIKVVIEGTEDGTPGDLAFGKFPNPFKIIELFGEPAIPDYPTNRLRKDVIHGYNCFMGAYVAAKIGGFNPLKLPDGTVF